MAHGVPRPPKLSRTAPHAQHARHALACALHAAGTLIHVVPRSVRETLLSLPDDAARARVWRWAGDVIGASLTPSAARGSTKSEDTGETIAELIDRTQPENRMERILVVASWLEGSTGGTDWTAQALNDELKQLGEGVPNITDALSTLIAKKPALIRQTRKTGRTQQARKRYTLTAAGRAVIASLPRR
jgi:hypothetical protein